MKITLPVSPVSQAPIPSSPSWAAGFPFPLKPFKGGFWDAEEGWKFLVKQKRDTSPGSGSGPQQQLSTNSSTNMIKLILTYTLKMLSGN